MKDSAGFMDHLKSELKKYDGVIVPVKATWLEGVLIRHVSINKLHPNPADEFCMDNIGPSFRIITEYGNKFGHDLQNGNDPFEDDPITVTKMRPDGYLILNGHHRWAAAMIMSLNRIRIEIVNITKASDIVKMLSKSKRSKRVTFDLDEVVFASEEGEYEKAPFSINKEKYKEKIRLGIPALMHFFHSHEYDVWVFSSKYYSMDYIKKLFRKYSVDIEGIVTGTDRKLTASEMEEKKKVDRLVANKYEETIHVDNETVVQSFSGGKDFNQYDIDKKKNRWSAEVMKIVEGMKSDE